MRISDWSSDVCSSDLRPPHRAPACPARGGAGRKRGRCGGRTSAASERALDFDALEALDLVARLHVVVLLHADTALGAAADLVDVLLEAAQGFRSEEHTSELQSLMRISYAVFCLKK